MRSHARVVVIGGGNMAAGVLYHLAKEGWTDCVLLEKAELTSGATWHAAGLVSRMVGGHALGRIHDTAVDLYKFIEAETDQAVSWHGCGSLWVATSDHHVDWIRHLYDCIPARGQEAQIVGPEEIGRLNPLYDLETAGVRCGLFTPDDGHVDPAGTCQAMAKGARLAGAEVARRCRVTGVRALPSGEWEVTSERGTIRCEHVVNAGGYHARQIGAWCGLDLPITPMQHPYVVTDDVPGFDGMGHELTNDATPRRVGMMRIVKRDRPFVGSEAAARQAESGSLLVALEVDADDADCGGGEAVTADGRLVGSVSSGGYGPITDKSLALAFVKPEVTAPGAPLDVSVFGDLRPARVLGEPVRDPDNRRLKVDGGVHV